MTYGKKTFLDDSFVQTNLMGPNCLRIIEELMSDLSFPPEARILDLGCGTGLTSIYLATEYGCQVFATDLWIPATENHRRFVEQGLEGRIIPIHADAHQLPYADDYFDAVVSVDSYQYFGTDPSFLDEKVVPLLKEGGTIAVSMPGLQPNLSQSMIPDELTTFWNGEDIDFYSLGWWEELWSKSTRTTKVKTFSHSSHATAWKEWLVCDNPYALHDVAMMEVESGNWFDTVGLIYRVDR